MVFPMKGMPAPRAGAQALGPKKKPDMKSPPVPGTSGKKKKPNAPKKKPMQAPMPMGAPGTLPMQGGPPK